MNQWRIRDLMTTDPVTVRDNAPVSEVADVLTERQITAVPVVDRLTFAVDDTLPAPRPPSPPSPDPLRDRWSGFRQAHGQLVGQEAML
jgi:CBS domain-containing protein